MVHYHRIDLSEGIEINKTSAQNKAIFVTTSIF